MTDLLVAEDVVAGYLPGVDILHGASIRLSAGELVGIIGPNGAGKSTLIKAIFGLVPVRSGSVTLSDDDITGLATHELVARGVGYVPQRANVFPSLTVEENLRMGLYLEPALWESAIDRIGDFFPVLLERKGQRAGLLSGGERQMLAISRALMMDPSVLLLDEPSAGLSPAIQDLVFERVSQICETGVSLIMVEQNAHQCLQLCDRAYVLDQGRNAHEGPGTELLHDHRVVELYLGTLGRID